MRLRIAFANDYLSPAKQIIEQVGADNVWRTLNEFGLVLNNTIPDFLSMDSTVYNHPVSLLSVVRGYGILLTRDS
jgi:hypothetical protein